MDDNEIYRLAKPPKKGLLHLVFSRFFLILVLVALIAGGAIGGIAGMLVAVPTAAFLKIQLDRWLEKREAKIAQASQEDTDDHR